MLGGLDVYENSKPAVTPKYITGIKLVNNITKKEEAFLIYYNELSFADVLKILMDKFNS